MAAKTQTMKPETAAKKLEVLLAATPESFRDRDITRDELAALQAEPPEWLVTLRREGPHPRSVVAGRLGVSNSGLARAGVNEPLTTAEIGAILEEAPDWLDIERERQKTVRAEAARVKRTKSGKAAM
ncbi:MAG: DUF5997 family protein [Pseudolysinimonas sp.]